MYHDLFNRKNTNNNKDESFSLKNSKLDEVLKDFDEDNLNDREEDDDLDDLNDRDESFSLENSKLDEVLKDFDEDDDYDDYDINDRVDDDEIGCLFNTKNTNNNKDESFDFDDGDEDEDKNTEEQKTQIDEILEKKDGEMKELNMTDINHYSSASTYDNKPALEGTQDKSDVNKPNKVQEKFEDTNRARAIELIKQQQKNLVEALNRVSKSDERMKEAINAQKEELAETLETLTKKELDKPLQTLTAEFESNKKKEEIGRSKS